MTRLKENKKKTFLRHQLNRSFPNCHKPLFQREAKCEAIDMNFFFSYSHAKKLIFTRNVLHLPYFSPLPLIVFKQVVGLKGLSLCFVFQLYNLCLYLTIIPRGRVGYEMIDSQRGA